MGSISKTKTSGVVTKSKNSFDSKQVNVSQNRKTKLKDIDVNKSDDAFGFLAEQNSTKVSKEKLRKQKTDFPEKNKKPNDTPNKSILKGSDTSDLEDCYGFLDENNTTPKKKELRKQKT